jgi:hypothetical protein
VVLFPSQLAHIEKVNWPANVADDCSAGSVKSIGPLVRFAFEGDPLVVGRDELSMPEEVR